MSCDDMKWMGVVAALHGIMRSGTQLASHRCDSTKAGVPNAPSRTSDSTRRCSASQRCE